MNNYKILQYGSITIALLLLATLAADAQILPPPPPPNNTGVPLDPLSWLMLAAGGAFAYRKYRKNIKED